MRVVPLSIVSADIWHTVTCVTSQTKRISHKHKSKSKQYNSSLTTIKLLRFIAYTLQLTELKTRCPSSKRLKVKDGDIALNGKPISKLQSVTCRMGSHIFTCHPTEVNAPRLNPSQISWHSIYLQRRDGRLSWPRRLVTYRDGLPASRQSPIQVLTRPGVE